MMRGVVRYARSAIKGFRVGVYYEDTDGSKILFETTAIKAKLIVEAHNQKYEAIRNHKE